MWIKIRILPIDGSFDLKLKKKKLRWKIGSEFDAMTVTTAFSVKKYLLSSVVHYNFKRLFCEAINRNFC